MRLLASLVCAFFLVHAPAGAAQFRETLGGPLGQYSTDDVDPPRVAPVERWRVKYDALLSDPVVHDGRLAIAVQRGRIAQLVLLDLADGSELFKTKIKRKQGPVGISLDEVYVTVVTDQEVVSGEFRGGKFKRRLRASGAFLGSVTTGGRFGLVPAKDTTMVYDLGKGRAVGEVSRCECRPVFIRDESSGGGRFYLLHQDSEMPFSFGPETEQPIAGEPPVIVKDWLGGERGAAPRGTAWTMHCLRAAGDMVAHVTLQRQPMRDAGEPCRLWYGGEGAIWTKNLTVGCTGPGVVWGDRLLGRLSDRSIWVVTEPGTEAAKPAQTKYEIFAIVDGTSLPDGAEDAPMSAARGVLLLGNWAVDIESSRVLWVAKDLDVVGRPIPAADGVIVFESADSALVCAGEPGGESAGGGPTLVSVGALGDGSAVVLRDGTRLEGEVEVDAETGAVRVGAQGSEPRSFESFEVAAQESAAGIERTTLPFALYRAATLELERELRTDLIGVAEQAAKLALVAHARRLGEEAERLGAKPEELEAMRRVLSTKKELRSGTRSVKVKKVEDAESAARAAAMSRRDARVRWLEAQGEIIQAGAVLAEYWRDRGALGPGGAVPDSIRESVARIRDFNCSNARWLRYARSLAPSNARRATKAEIRTIDAQTKAWERAHAYMSPRISLLTHEKSIDVVSGVLRFGEGTIEALERLLGADPDVLDERFDVRLHADREAYLAEKVEGVALAPRFSAGVYIPGIKTSRFYVPDVDPGRLERLLYKVVAHELTHQFIQERWVRRPDNSTPRKPTSPGFWIVEGLAGFVEAQSVEMARYGLALNDATVSSIEIASAMRANGRLIPLKRFLAMSQVELYQLEGEAFEVQLEREAVALEVSPIAAYYAQAAALSFFLVQRAGGDKRARFYDALEAHYKGRTKRNGAKALGYASAAELETAFRAFLQNPLAD